MRGGGKRQRISYLRCSSVPEIPPFPPTKLAGDMFIVNESSTSLRRFVEDCYVSQGHGSGQGGKERERKGRSRKRGSSRDNAREREEDRIRVVRRVVARASARLLLRFMRPLPSPLAQLSSRYNIVVYSEPRLRSVNHPYVSPFLAVPPASLRWLGHPRNPLIFLTRRGRREGDGE